MRDPSLLLRMTVPKGFTVACYDSKSFVSSRPSCARRAKMLAVSLIPSSRGVLGTSPRSCFSALSSRSGAMGKCLPRAVIELTGLGQNLRQPLQELFHADDAPARRVSLRPREFLLGAADKDLRRVAHVLQVKGAGKCDGKGALQHGCLDSLGGTRTDSEISAHPVDGPGTNAHARDAVIRKVDARIALVALLENAVVRPRAQGRSLLHRAGAVKFLRPENRCGTGIDDAAHQVAALACHLKYV